MSKQRLCNAPETKMSVFYVVLEEITVKPGSVLAPLAADRAVSELPIFKGTRQCSTSSTDTVIAGTVETCFMHISVIAYRHCFFLFSGDTGIN